MNPRTNPGEEWRAVVGYEGLYQVSNHGRVWSVRAGKLLKTGLREGSYHKVTLQLGGQTWHTDVHVLVAAAFLGPRPKGQQVCHGRRRSPDGSVCDHADNLSYGTVAENNADKVRDGTWQGGEAHNSAKLTNAQIADIRRLWESELVPGHRHRIHCGHTLRYSTRKLAELYGVKQATIQRITSGKTWGHVVITPSGRRVIRMAA